jgi:hypothetical protein
MLTVGHDGQAPELAAPRDLDGKDRRQLPELENFNTDRIRWLYRHGKLTDIEYYAAETLQRDCQLAQIGGYASSGNGGGAGTGLADAKLDAIARVGAARAALVPTAWRLVEMVAVENIGLAVAAVRLWGRSARYERLLELRCALGVLAAHYDRAAPARV